MMKRLLTLTSSSVASAAALVGFFSVLSRFLGLIRDRVLVHTVGVGDVLDAYYAAFRIPDTVFQLLIMGTLSASFIPLFLKYWNKHEEKAWEYTNYMLTSILLVFGVISLACIFAAPFLAQGIAFGFDAPKQALTASMMRVIFLSQGCFAISMVFGSVLQATRRFFLYSCAPIVYNVGIIFGAYFLVPVMGPWGIAWGTVCGAFLHMLLQALGVYALGFSFRPMLAFSADVRATLFAMGPRTFGLAIAQVNFLFMTMMASTLGGGSVAMLQFAYNLNYFPIGIIAVSYAIAAFPAFCDAMSSEEKKKQGVFGEVFRATVRQVLFFLVPATVLFLFLRAQIVRLVLGAQNFSWTATVLTADALALFALSFCAQGLIFVLVRGFFAQEKNAPPVIAALCGAAINMGGAFLLMPLWGLLGLVASFSVAACVQCVILWLLLRASVGTLGGRLLFFSLIKTLTAALGMAVVVQSVKYALVAVFPLTTFFAVFVQLVGASTLGMLVYVLLAFFLRSEECLIFFASLRAKMLRAASPKELPAPDTGTATG